VSRRDVDKIVSSFRSSGRQPRRSGSGGERRHRERQVGGYATGQARGSWESQQRGPQHEQYRDDEVVVQVRSGYSHDQQVPTTDVQVNLRDGSGDHQHTVLDPYGDVIFDEWRRGRRGRQ
jgi:hypothetical protein